MRRSRNPKYVKSYRDAAGNYVRQYRRNGRTIRLPNGRDLDAAFWEAYDVAERTILEGGKLLPAAVARIKANSVEAALVDYYRSTAFSSDLSENTRDNYRGVLESDFRAVIGDLPLAKVTTKHLMDLIAKKIAATSPGRGKILLAALRSFTRYAVAADLVPRDPAIGIRPPKMVESEGYHTWSEQQIAQFEDRWPEGSTPRLALALHLYLGPRLSDVIRLGAQHLRGGIIRFTQKKTGAELAIPVHPDLQRLLDRLPPPAPGPNGEVHLNFLLTPSGTPFREGWYGEQFRVWTAEAGLPAECTSHGLRKAAITRLAHLGLSLPVIMSISGHKTASQVQVYIDRANQEKLAAQAIAALPSILPAIEPASALRLVDGGRE